MASERPPLSEPDRPVLRFRRRGVGPQAKPPVADLAQFEHGKDDENYWHRMIVNAAAFVFVLALIGAGLWLADTLAQMRRGQDCVLSGRRGCTPVEFSKERW